MIEREYFVISVKSPLIGHGEFYVKFGEDLTVRAVNRIDLATNFSSISNANKGIDLANWSDKFGDARYKLYRIVEQQTEIDI